LSNGKGAPEFHLNSVDYIGVGFARATIFTNPSRLILAGETETVGIVLQSEEAPALCGGGVGETPWCQVEVP